MKKVILTYNSEIQELKIEVLNLKKLKNGSFTDKGSKILSTEVLSDLNKKYIIPEDKNELDTFIKGVFKDSNTIRGLIGEDGFITDIILI